MTATGWPGDVECGTCHMWFDPRGIAPHRSACGQPCLCHCPTPDPDPIDECRRCRRIVAGLRDENGARLWARDWRADLQWDGPS